MAQKSVQGNKALGKQIRSRRNELGLTIEDAAMRAGISTKTWCRYEAGESIRTDKCKGVCKALYWRVLPVQEMKDVDVLSLQEYKNHEAWSVFLEKNFGIVAAISFAAGSDILLDALEDTMQALSSMPAGSHIGQVDCFCLGNLPEQFLMQYDYTFLYQMKCVLHKMRIRAKAGLSMTAHSVLEELIFFLCNEEALALLELSNGICDIDNYDADWIFSFLDDMDFSTFLYSSLYLDAEHPYHFSNWTKEQFYIEEC